MGLGERVSWVGRGGKSSDVEDIHVMKFLNFSFQMSMHTSEESDGV